MYVWPKKYAFVEHVRSFTIDKRSKWEYKDIGNILHKTEVTHRLMEEQEKDYMLRYVFGYIFLLSNRIQTLMDSYLGASRLTTRQWLMLAVIDEFFDGPPTLSEAARVMGTSHQNARRMAGKLEENGFLQVQKDPLDSRTLRLVLTDQTMSMIDALHQQDQGFFRRMSSGCSDEDLVVLYRCLCRLESNALGQEVRP